MAYVVPDGNAINFNLSGLYSTPGGNLIGFNLGEESEQGFVDIPLNIGTNVLDIYYDSCYVLVCTTSGVECLDSRTLSSVWYFNSTIVKSVCSDQSVVCFGTTSSGIYYNDFPGDTNDLGDFLSSCTSVEDLTSSCINDICTTVGSGFFAGGENGIDILVSSDLNELSVSCQLTCSGVNSVACSENTGTYYWSTENAVYSSDTCE